LLPKRGVEARRVDAERLGDVRDADGVVAARMERVLSGGDRLLGSKRRGGPRWAIICSHHYKILDPIARIIM
jgi:hypothetical protein